MSTFNQFTESVNRNVKQKVEITYKNLLLRFYYRLYNNKNMTKMKMSYLPLSSFVNSVASFAF